VVYGDDSKEANDNAAAFSSLKGSGVLGLQRPLEGQNVFDTVESSGQGAQQFQAAVQYLETMMTQSVLASFMDLPAAAAGGQGSYALSADQSEFFLTSRQAVADEMAQCINRNLIAPLIHYNYGDIELPKIEIGPLSNRTTERALGLLQAIIAAPQVNVPIDFVGELVKYTANYLGLNEDEVVQQVDQYTEKRKSDDEETRVALLKVQQQASQPQPAAGGSTIPGGNVKGLKRDVPNTASDNKARSQKIRDGVAASLTDDQLIQTAVEATFDLVSLTQEGYDPKDLLIK
jgi:hypothetical protein